MLCLCQTHLRYQCILRVIPKAENKTFKIGAGLSQTMFIHKFEKICYLVQKLNNGTQMQTMMKSLSLLSLHDKGSRLKMNGLLSGGYDIGS